MASSREVLVHGVVELPGAGQVDAERLLHHHPRVLRAARAGDSLRDPPEQLGRHLHVVQDLLARTDLIRHGLVGGLVAEIPVHVAQQPEHLRRRSAVRVHVVELQRGGGVVAELLQPPPALGHPDHRDVQHAALHQPHQRREGLDLGQVASGAEDHQRVNLVCRHSRLLCRIVICYRFHRGAAMLASLREGDSACDPASWKLLRKSTRSGRPCRLASLCAPCGISIWARCGRAWRRRRGLGRRQEFLPADAAAEHVVGPGLVGEYDRQEDDDDDGHHLE